MNLCKLFGHKHVEKKGKRIIKHSKCMRCGRQKPVGNIVMVHKIKKTNLQVVGEILQQDTKDELVLSYQKELPQADITATLTKIMNDQCPGDFGLDDLCIENACCEDCWNKEAKTNGTR